MPSYLTAPVESWRELRDQDRRHIDDMRSIPPRERLSVMTTCLSARGTGRLSARCANGRAPTNRWPPVFGRATAGCSGRCGRHFRTTCSTKRWPMCARRRPSPPASVSASPLLPVPDERDAARAEVPRAPVAPDFHTESMVASDRMQSPDATYGIAGPSPRPTWAGQGTAARPARAPCRHRLRDRDDPGHGRLRASPGAR
jgi:hypothetical protein